MRWLITFLRKPWVLPLIGIVLFSLIVWFVGPLVAIAGKVPLASANWRLLVIMAAMLVWGLNNLRVKKQEASASAALTEGLRADAQKAPAVVDAVNPDEHMLNKRLQDSLALLKGSRFEREGKLYKLPWYIIIGAPGSGKTTAIQNSGLQFPLQDKIGNEPVKGEGGTRYCDWWFTDNAILIDTAGRYTTQDNPQKIESGAWLGFLSRIKKARPKRPLNGIIITISLQDVLSKTATQKSLQITAIKQRIQELNNHLQMKLPVYVLFSKMDMIAGFSSFFADMEKKDREQMWGFAARGRTTSSEDISTWFESEYASLIENLYQRVNHRLNRESSQQKRSLISEFPRQMQALQSQLEEFVSKLFSTNQFEAPLFLRGVFFLSSTQHTSASQWITSLAPPELMAPPADHTEREPKTFFVQSLFKDFIFSEANVASVNEKVTQRFRAAYVTLMALAVSGFVGAVYALGHSKSLNEQYITSVSDAVEVYQESTSGGLMQPHSWQVLNQGLNLLRDLPSGFTQAEDHYTLEQGFGLYQGDKLGAQARATYVQSLSSFLMEDFSLLLLEQVQNAHDDDERLYEALKFYLMLYHPEHLDKDSLIAWADVLWARKLPGSQQEEVRRQLSEHLQNALAQQALPAPMDQSAVAAARATLIKTPLDLRAYRRIKSDYLQQHPQQFSVQGVLGNKASLIFSRRSGLSLSEGIPAFFTFDGFHAGFNLASVKLAQKLADEQWIYGDTLAKQLTDEDLEAVKASVNDHYMQEYQTRWDFFLNDLALQPFGTINRGKTVVRQLASADEPLITLLKAIRKNTALSEMPGLDKDTTKALGKVAETVASQQKSRLERLVPGELISKKAKLPGQEINRYYAEFNNYVANGSGGRLLDLQEAIHGLNYYLQKLVYAEDMGQAAFASTSGDGQKQALTQLQIAVDEAPQQIRPWFNGLGKNTAKVAIVATKTHLNTSWQGDVLSFYELHLKGKYPLDKTSQQDIKLSDFTAFFGPGGVLDSYFQQYLAPFVDTSGRQWRWKKPSGMSNQALDFFQRAQSIKQAYFNNGDELNVTFTLKPHTLDKTASSISLDVNGENLNYHHGPPNTQRFQWPGVDPTANKLMFHLVSQGTPVSVSADGEWGWFKLLDQYANAQPAGVGEGLLFTFNVSGIRSTQELRPTGSKHPFDQALLDGFNPPGRL